MENFKIILFLCNWNPHTAFNTLQEKDYRIPPEVRMIRIPCSGRIDKALMIKAFEMGADGVALVGCKSGTCRYGPGPDSSGENTKDTRSILELLGLGKERMINEYFLPDESKRLSEFLNKFCKDIKKMGKSPIKPAPKKSSLKKRSIEKIVKTHNVYACLDCGKCTSSCPLALIGREYSPRNLVTSIIKGEIESKKEDIYACLTCGICYERCPSGVNFPLFIKDLRSDIEDKETCLAHRGFFQSLMRSMTSEELMPNHWKNLPLNIEIDQNSKTLFFGGCAPYFDVFFKNKIKTFNILSDSLKLLNFFDLKPRLIKSERCCGHDLLWSGDRENFIRLARLNTTAINDLKIERVITSCPECYRTIKYDYPKYGIEPEFEVIHIYEFIEKQLEKGSVAFTKYRKKITYQDSCRLNRIDNISDLPRRLIENLSVNNFEEMQDSKKSALCCGNCAWTGCDSYTKAMQVKRLNQAHETGSDVLVTSCPKCQIHLQCAMEDPFLEQKLKMDMLDLTSLILKTIRYE